MDSKRLYTALAQEAKGMNNPNIKEAVDATREVVEVCGDASRNRKMIFRIGKIILLSELAPTIIAPSCPDYTQENGRYTFTDIGGGVSFLAEQQINFLQGITEVLPDAKVQVLVADQEAEDSKIAAACNKTPEEFRQLISSSVDATNAVLDGVKWTAQTMTSAIPAFYESEAKKIAELTSGEIYSRRLAEECKQRVSLYKSIDASLSDDEMLQRTIRTASQYLTVGGFAAESGYLISNHTTTNLGWYNDAGAAILHNPLALY